ncbi:mRNA interferase YafO [Pseudomonas lundensis]|jgi:mRNA interferase YafO|uniref:type II toxin-antitoxin system YafO family toxin n=1 Tax=Pseudomonas lundensis TaxID=86185 RepID=UPI0008848323|nr:type II toxin-antitoxin system YafO family toxin [Pseudomonas lundensis]SDQ80202.1 mRNA interferase YafO [Pseudomonas lundensis]
MTCAVIGATLNICLTPQEAAHLVKEFCLWKDGGIDPGDYFGKDTAFMRPKSVVDAGIRKVHLETQSVTPAWNRMMGSGIKDPDRYTSDKILVYVHLGDVKNTPYLLLAILEPGHAQMSDPDLVRGLAVLYEDERSAFARTFPDPQWITAGF